MKLRRRKRQQSFGVGEKERREGEEAFCPQEKEVQIMSKSDYEASCIKFWNFFFCLKE